MENSLYSQWNKKAGEHCRFNKKGIFSKKMILSEDSELFWERWQEDKNNFYRQLLSINELPILNTTENLAEMFNVDILTFVGILEDINEYLKNSVDLDTLTATTMIALDYDCKVLYKGMLDMHYDLSVWDSYYDKDSIDIIKTVNKILKSKDKGMMYSDIYTKDIISAGNIVKKYCECDELDELKLKSIINLYMEEYSKDPEVVMINKMEMDKHLHKPKCPTCGSTNVKKLGAFYSTGFTPKYFECNNCGYMW